MPDKQNRIRRSLQILGSLAAVHFIACAPAPAPRAPIPSSPPAPTPAGEPERVVLITIDTLRADYVGCYGSQQAHTPTLDRIADRGVRFETAISPTPITMPSHTSLMTGLEPPRHGVHSNGKFRLDNGIPTLAEQFHRAGFATAAFVSAVVLDHRYGLDRGFEVYDDKMGYRRNIVGATGAYAERTADQVVDAAREWLRAAPSRFFLWVHFYDPHANYDPPPGFRPKRKSPARNLDRTDLFKYAQIEFPPLYSGEIYFTDTELGRLLRFVQNRWRDDRTLFVITSDHGESLGEHNELTHTLGVYDATQRIPLLMAGPGVPQGRVVKSPVRLIDVAPTILGLAGLSPLPDSTGENLEPWMLGERDDPLDAYVETLETHLGYGWSPVLGVRDDRYKYLRTVRPELYDLNDDPHELRNVAAQRPAVIEQFESKLAAHLAGALPVQPNVVAPPEVAALLESLGYVMGESETNIHPLGWIGGTDPKDAVATFARLLEARSLLAAGDPQRAREVLDPAPEAGGWIAHARAEVALALGEFEEAEREARAMIAAQPHQAEGYLTLGSVLEAQKRLHEAQLAYLEAARINPTETQSRVALGRIAEAQEDSAAAAAHYQEALDSSAPNVNAALRMAALLYDRGETAQAQGVLRTLKASTGGRPEAWIRLAHAEANAGYRDDALARLERAMKSALEDSALSAAHEEISGETRN